MDAARIEKLGKIGATVRALLEGGALARDDAEEVLCVLLAHNTFRDRRQDEWPEAAAQVLEKLKGYIFAGVRRRESLLAQVPPRGHA